jgi:hypothetical protein
MTSQELEEYCFLRLYSGDLNGCRHVLRMIRRYRKPDIRYALIRDLAVTYARPFSGNDRKVRGKHSLSLDYVPTEHRGIHRRLCDLRNFQFAHSSLKFHNPKLAQFGDLVAMSRKSVDFAQLDRSLIDIEILVVQVESNINSAAFAMQARL